MTRVIETAAAERGAQPRIVAIVPAYNEARSIRTVVERIQLNAPLVSVVVVSDGSTDNTAWIAEQAGATVVTLPVNLGIGGAVQTGYLYALRKGFDIAVQIDGDGQHDPSELSRLISPIVANSSDVVVGSRWLGRGDYKAPRSRRLGMRILASIVQRKTDGRITDTTSGFRAVNRRGIELFATQYPTDFPEVETLVLAHRNGLRLAEVGVRMNPRIAGQSSIAGTRSAYYMARVIVVLIIDSFRQKGLS